LAGKIGHFLNGAQQSLIQCVTRAGIGSVVEQSLIIVKLNFKIAKN
jgi:hypothetical protein